MLSGWESRTGLLVLWSGILCTGTSLATGCPQVDQFDELPDRSRYFSISWGDFLNEYASKDVRDCIGEYVVLARLGEREGVEQIKALENNAVGRVLAYLMVTPIEEVGFSKLMSQLSAADSEVLWDQVLFSLEMGPRLFVDELDRGRLRSWMPANKELSVRYAELLRRSSRESAYWEVVTSEIVMDAPEVLFSGTVRDRGIVLDLCVMKDWLVSQSREVLDALVMHFNSAQREKLALFFSPEIFSPLSSVRIVSASVHADSELPVAWEDYVDEHLGDWIDAGMPEPLREAPVWDLEHQRHLIDSGSLIEEITQLLDSVGLITAAYILYHLDAHESVAVQRYSATMKFGLQPGYHLFSGLVSSGVTPRLIAHNVSKEQAVSVIAEGMSKPNADALSSFVAELPCEMMEGDDWSLLAKQSNNAQSVVQALETRLEECQP